MYRSRSSRPTATALLATLTSLGLAGSIHAQDPCAVAMEQQPDAAQPAFVSDVTFPAAQAEAFTLVRNTRICEIVVWGVYDSSPVPPASDLMTLRIHADASGLPGTVLHGEAGIAAVRTATGNLNVGGNEIHRYVLTPSSDIDLSPGTYWIELFNDTTAGGEDWYWQAGTVDPVYGIPGRARALEAPGVTFAVPANNLDLALRVVGRPCPRFVDQQPDATLPAFASDALFPAAQAESFTLSETIRLCDVVVWGVYDASVPPASDSLALRVHADDSGLPGTVLYSEAGIATLREATGDVNLGGNEIYRYLLTPASHVELSAGTYWVEVTNDTTAGGEDWAWQAGVFDPVSGIPGRTRAFEVPGVTFSVPSNNLDLAFQVRGKTPEYCSSFCSSLPNATGSAALLTCSGEPNSSLVLTSTPVPNTTGQFFFGPMMLAGASALGDGLRCVGGPVTRMLPFVSAGMMAQPPNTARFSVTYTAPYAAGLTGTQYFQYWFRSGLATGTGSNSSDALAITF